jgi:hypothetical protein
MTYDDLRERHSTAVAARQYLQILQRAARENEAAVDDALRALLDAGEAVDADQVARLLSQGDPVPCVTAVTVEEPDLSCFDALLEEQEVLDGCEQGCERHVSWLSARVASADLSGML